MERSSSVVVVPCGSILMFLLYCPLLFLSCFAILFFTADIATLPISANQFISTNTLRSSKPQMIRLRNRRTALSSEEIRAVLPADNHTTALLQTAPSTVVKRSAAQLLEEGLTRARMAIRDAAAASSNHNFSSSSMSSDLPSGEIYRNAAAFHQSYLEMEKRFKVYVYEEGEPPLIHAGPCKDIYTTEGRFIHELELDQTGFRTRDPAKAHVYFMPFSVTMIVTYLYRPNTYDLSPLRHIVADYVRVVSAKYPFWNATLGADHFMLSCHDWGPHASRADPLLFNNSIRVLCNANTSEGFDPRKDVSLPEINLRTGELSPRLLMSTSPPEPPDQRRRFLAFFAGGLHGPIRPLLLRHWKARDRDLQVYEYLPKDLDYYSFMFKSRYCLCPSGYEVASPRIVEAIYTECVPVIISDHYVLPFSDIFRWDNFSVSLAVSDIPRLKEILMGIGEEEYRRLREGVKAVKGHFVLNQPPKRFDVFHMILHSIWLRRLNIRLS